jgi:hypothetical protein
MSSIELFTRPRVRASEVAMEMLESLNMCRCMEDLLPRMNIIDDRFDANDILHRVANL